MPYKDKEFHRQYRKEKRDRVRQWLCQYKSERGCADCGWNVHHAGLEFDHVEKKQFTVANMCHYSHERLLAELAKCEVVCGTCHNMRTWKRRQ